MLVFSFGLICGWSIPLEDKPCVVDQNFTAEVNFEWELVTSGIIDLEASVIFVSAKSCLLDL